MRAALGKIAQSDNAIYTEDLRTLIAENAMQRDELRGNGHGAIGGAGSGRLQPPVRTQGVLVFHTHRPHRHGESRGLAFVEKPRNYRRSPRSEYGGELGSTCKVAQNDRTDTLYAANQG